MGRLILCAGERSANPYFMELGNIRLYSIEELCYYFYNNLYAVKEEMFSEELLAWIREELALPKLTEKLQVLLQQRYAVKDMLVTVFCSCDYYSEKEIREAVQILEELELLSDEQRACMKADNYMQYHKYAKAAVIYEKLLGDSGVLQKFSEKEQGKIYHNLAVAYTNIASCKDAADSFEMAYKVGGQEESLKQYLFALKLGGMQERYQNAIASYGVTTEKKKLYERELGRCMMDADDYMESKAVLKLRNLRQQGRVGDYYEGIDTVLAHWKEVYLEEQLA